MNRRKLISTTLIAVTLLSFIVMPVMAKPYQLLVIVKNTDTHQGVPGVPIDIWGTDDGVNWDHYIGHSTTGNDGTALFSDTSFWERDGWYTTIRVNAAGQSIECKLNPKYGGRCRIII